MDPLKKIVADRLKTQVAGAHPHGEVLSAFAENALSESERESVLQHLSTCSDCREIIFLAAPVDAESQGVVSVPKPRSVFALRWGTLAACIVIAAVFLVSRHQSPRTEQVAKHVPQTTSSAATDAIVAAEKTPAELTKMRDKLPAPVHASAGTGHAEPKHITAKPEGAMSFGDSGEVSVNAPAAMEAKVEPRSLPKLETNGRNVADLKQMSPPAVPVTNAPVAAGTGMSRGVPGGATVGGTIGANVSSYSANSSDFAAKKDSAFNGSVSGTVFDASGAVIPDAKVTALGPVGSRTVTADSAGKYSLDQLATGNYQFQVSAQGFRQTELQQVAVLANKPANVDVKLAPGAATEMVSVEAAAPKIVQQSQQQGALQSAQQSALQTDEQQQSANQIQAEEVTVEAASKVQKTAKSKDKTRTAAQPVPALARAVAGPVWQWSLSPQGVVQRSVDNGKNWQPVSVAAGATFRAVSSLLNHIWAGGKSGVLYHSADSGQHWIEVVPTTGAEKLQGDITQLQLVDSQHVVLTTLDSETWVTADGGQTWSRR